MKKIAIMGSGNGSNFEAIVKYFAQKPEMEVDITCLTDDVNAYILTRAKNLGVKYKYLPFEQNGAYFAVNNFDLIVLAGYMRILPEDVLNLGKFINIHPSLLPAFKGKDAIHRAFDAGVKVSGVTIHHVTSDLDGGKIIAQYPVLIGNLTHFDEFEAEIHNLEHKLYPIVIEKLLKDEVFDFSDLLGGCSGNCSGCH
mgnify:CR=1 FL=1